LGKWKRQSKWVSGPVPYFLSAPCYTMGLGYKQQSKQGLGRHWIYLNVSPSGWIILFMLLPYTCVYASSTVRLQYGACSRAGATVDQFLYAASCMHARDVFRFLRIRMVPHPPQGRRGWKTPEMSMKLFKIGHANSYACAPY
jgi:hypothetical protein